ncbi:MAG TPA: hypothetical protein VFW24_06015, partial [Acidimicrobiales bacterium]|nr:hypothetical protein [Acidimicrobiales bacterium]
MTVHRSGRIGGRCPDPSPSRPAAIALLVVLALLAAACGARVQPYLGAGQAGVTPGAGGQTAAGGAPSAGGGAAAPGATSGAAPALGSSGPAAPG